MFHVFHFRSYFISEIIKAISSSRGQNEIFYCYVKSNYDPLNNNNIEFFYIIILCRGNKATLQLKTIVFRCVQAECDLKIAIA